LNDLSRVLFVSPHPDDESLAAFGLLLRARESGGELRILFVTSGEWNPLPQRYLERRLILDRGARQRWGERRRNEAVAALSLLGIEASAVRFLGLPDNSLLPLCRDIPESILRPFLEEIERFAPTMVVRPSGADTHPDHRAAALAVRAAIERSGRPVEQLVYVTHGRENGTPAAMSIELSEEERQLKLKAVGCYASQLALSRSRFVAQASRPNEIFFRPSVEAPPAFPLLQRVIEVMSLGRMPGLALRRVKRGFELLHFRPQRADANSKARGKGKVAL
jgi:LmbE family N-acetylglucosaminyl deacetylase